MHYPPCGLFKFFYTIESCSFASSCVSYQFYPHPISIFGVRLIALRNDNGILVQLSITLFTPYAECRHITLTLTQSAQDGNVINSQQIHIVKSKFANMWTRLDVLGHIFLVSKRKLMPFLWNSLALYSILGNTRKPHVTMGREMERERKRERQKQEGRVFLKW